MSRSTRNVLYRAASLLVAWLSLSSLLALWIGQSLRAASGQAPPWSQLLTTQLGVWAPWLVLTPLALTLGGRWVGQPGGAWRWTVRGVAVLAGSLALNAGFVAWELAARDSLSPDAVWRALVVNGALPILTHAFLFAFLAGTGWGRRQAELRRRRRQLWSEARLQALVAKLQPHFLFNALNAVSALVDRDPPAARRMLACLGDLLRSTLEGTDRPEIPLREELEVLEKYVAIERIRHGDRLRFEMDVQVPDDTLIPPLLLQTLVENAFRHGLARDHRAGLVRLRIEKLASPEDGEQELRVAVEDDGPGPPPRPALGIGLSSTRDRLEVLYAGRGRLRLARRPEGGAVVEAVFPWRRASSTEVSRDR